MHLFFVGVGAWLVFWSCLLVAALTKPRSHPPRPFTLFDSMETAP